MSTAGVRRGAWAGAVAGIACVAAMEVLARLVGLETLPALLQDPLLSVMPGPVFGLLGDVLPARNILASDFTMLNERLAAHYGLPPVQGVALRRTPLPKHSPRGGLRKAHSVAPMVTAPRSMKACRRPKATRARSER